MGDFAQCSECGVVIHCGGGEHRGDLPAALLALADEYERGAMFRTGGAVAKRLRAVVEEHRVHSPPASPSTDEALDEGKETKP